MGYCEYKNHIVYSEEAVGRPLDRLPEHGEVLYLFRRPPLAGRESFHLTAPSAAEGPEALTTLTAKDRLPRELEEAVEEGRVRAVNMGHPRWEELLEPFCLPGSCRVNLLALGDVGSTLAMGLRLLGGHTILDIGLCDLRENVPERWEFELGQIGIPGPGVKVVRPEELFDCDVFLFCASRFVPDTAVKSGDVRMAQYALNRPLVASYARRAREAGFKGMFCVVSDPVDPLCRAALLESNKNEAGELDCKGLFPHQVRGFGLGVMHARAQYYADRDPRFEEYLRTGRAYGPHGEGLVIANSVEPDRYDGALSRELTERTKHANLEMRAMGFKPYAAPALSSGALSLLDCLRGQWHFSSTYLDGVFMGARNRLGALGIELERLPLPEDLLERIRGTMDELRRIE